MHRRGRHLRRTLLALLVVGAIGAATGGVYGAFFATTNNPAGAFTAKRIFPGDRYQASWSLHDASGGGAETNASSTWALDDARTLTTAASWANAYSATRYLQFDFSAPLPDGLPLDGLTFSFDVAPTQAANSACYFVDVRARSTNTVLATYGSSGSPLACNAGTASVLTTTSLPAVATTTAANDLRVRVWGWTPGSNTTRTWNVDLASVTATVLGVPITISAETLADVSGGGAAATSDWALAAADGVSYQSAALWTTAFASTRYLRVPFAKSIPGSARDVTVTLEHTYRPDRNGDNACWYADVLSGTTVVQTAGSSGTPAGCNSTFAFVTDSVALSSVDTAEEVNDLVLKLYVRNAASRRTQHDMVRIKVSYTLDAGTDCADDGAQTLAAAADTYVNSGSTGTNYGTGTTMLVRSQSNNRQRTLVRFDLPAIPANCTLVGATLRQYLQTQGGARTLDATAIDASWTETGVTWANQPATSGAPASAATTGSATWMAWDVLGIVQGQYAGSNHGILVADASEGNGNVTQTFQTRETLNAPELVLTLD